jgi:archaellum biogenesis ATPase FlaH
VPKKAKEQTSEWKRIVDEITRYGTRAFVVAIFGMVAVLYGDHVATKENTRAVASLEVSDKHMREELERQEDVQDSILELLRHAALIDSLDKVQVNKQLREIRDYMKEIKKALN